MIWTPDIGVPPFGFEPTPSLVTKTSGWAATSQASGPLESYVASNVNPLRKDSAVSQPVGWAPTGGGAS